MPDELLDERIPVRVYEVLHERGHLRPLALPTHFHNGQGQGLFSHIQKPLNLGSYRANGQCCGCIGTPAVQSTARIDTQDVPLAEPPVAGNTMNHLLVDRSTDIAGKRRLAATISYPL